MRVGFDIGKIADLDGIGSYCRELLRALPNALAEGETLCLYSPQTTVAPEIMAEVLPGLQSATTTGAGGGRVELRLDRDPAGDDLDLYHATRWHCPPGLGARGLFTCYDLTVLDHPQCHTVSNRIHSLEGLLDARLAGWHFLSISRTTAEALASWFEVPSEQQTVIYPAVAPIFTDPRPAEHQLAGEPGGGENRWESPGDGPEETVDRGMARRFGLDGRPVLAVGTLEPRKNLPRLLEAYGRLPEALRRRHPLVLAGGMGWQNPAELDALLGRPELAGVRRLGAVSIDDLLVLYRGAALFAYPSLAEGFGLPILEAMACGAPVLTSAGGATEETAGGAARLVPPTETEAMATALAELLADPAERLALQRRGLARAREFSWQETAGLVAALYRRLLP